MAKYLGIITYTAEGLKGLKDKPKRALVAYYDDILGNVENK